MTRQSAKFGWLEAYAYSGKNLPSRAMMVLLHHADGDTLQCHPSEPTIAKACGITERAVRKQIAANKAAGWVEVVQRYDRSNVYTLTIPDRNDSSSPTGESGTITQGERNNSSTQRGTIVPPNRSLDKPVIDQSIDQEKGGTIVPHPEDVTTSPDLRSASAGTEQSEGPDREVPEWNNSSALDPDPWANWVEPPHPENCKCLRCDDEPPF